MHRQPPLGDKIARAYCFKARCYVTDRSGGRILGSFVAYGKSPQVTEDVKKACAEAVALEFPPDAMCDSDVELVLLDECPVECSEDVQFEDT